MPDYQKYLDPRTLDKLSRLEYRARQIVEGFVSGMHRSPYQGFSVEFAAHREYAPGDDLRHLDWKVFGRSDRLYIKQYEQETNLRCHFLVDCSESMDYRSEDLSKFDVACRIAASLSYLMLQQQDAIGLVLFNDEITSTVEPSGSPAQLDSLLSRFEGCEPASNTRIGTIFHQVAQKISKRGLVIIVSDLFDRPEDILRGLQLLRSRRHEVTVFHVLDKYEVEFPFQRMTLFDGLEDYPRILADPRALRKAYVAEVKEFIHRIKTGCLAERIDYVNVTTDQALDVVLPTYLAQRMGRRKSQ